MKTILLYISFLMSLTISAQNAKSLFNQANEAYKKGNYQAAITAYEKALQTDSIAPELYFNLGNAYYKLNRIAPSIYYYEKALKLNPDDEDVRYNLQLANQMKLDKIDQVPQNILARFKTKMNRLFAFDTWAWLSIFSAFSGLLVFIIFLFTKNTNTKRVTFVLMWLSLFLMIFTWYNAELGQKRSAVKYAIIFTPKVDLMTEPNLTSDVVSSLHEGAKVQLLKTDGNWDLIKLADGKKAWVPQSDIKVIN